MPTILGDWDEEDLSGKDNRPEYGREYENVLSLFTFVMIIHCR